MPDFDLRVTSGASIAPWTDPATDDAPSRVNARTGNPLRRYVATVGTQVEIRAVVGATVAPLDSALGGRLFVPFAVDCPLPAVEWSSPAGQSSIQRFTPARRGHYHVRVRRPGGGVVHLHIDAEEP